MIRVYVAGVGMTQFGKSSKTLVELLCEAAVRALTATKMSEVEAVYIGAMNPEEFTGESNVASRVAEGLNMNGIPAIRVETASSAGAAAFSAGFQAVASGCYRRVLVVGGEKMTHLNTSTTTRIVAEVLDPQERRCGATLPALAAMVIEKYRSQYHLSHSRLEKILSAVAMKNHFNGSQNPYAQFRNPISRDQYLSSKLVATPLRLYDCAPISDGAAAVVLTSEATDIVVSGLGQATAPVSLRLRESLTSFRSSQIAARKAYAMAGCAPEEIDFAEVHDAFTPFEIISSEDIGFFPPGKGGDAVESGKTGFDGIKPINASGGLKARGHPIGASGVAQICESARLLRGVSGIKLKREPRRGLAQSTGALATNNFVTIVERATPGAQVQNSRPAMLGTTEDGGQRTVEQRQMTDHRGRRTGGKAGTIDDRRAWTEARIQTTEDRRLETGGKTETTEDGTEARTGTTTDGGPGTDARVETTEDRRLGTKPKIETTEDRRPKIEAKTKSKINTSAPVRREGKIETFTILHTTAEGFLPPLALALVRDRKGSLVMARGEDARDLKIGREVYLREAGGIYLFKVKSYLRQVREAMRHFLTRATG